MSNLAPKHLGAFILLHLATALPFCITQSTYYVKPTPDTPCHEDPCHTLSEFVNESLTSNTTMVFLPGEHALQENVTVRNLVGFVLQHSSSSSTQIVCNNNTFTFDNLSSIEITGLSFISCRFHLNNSQAIFRDTGFRNSAAYYGGALEANHSTIDFAGFNNFEGNWAVMAGGAIFANDSKFTFHGNTSFINNKAMNDRGGGVYMWSSTVSFDGNNTFVHNSAEGKGGGIYMSHSTVSFNGNNTFVHNSAEDDGGGVCMWRCSVSFEGKNSFVHNSAGYNGGGVYMGEGNMSFNGNNTFVHNSAEYDGGGVYMGEGNMSFNGNNTFAHNSAEYDGGGVFMWKGTAIFKERNSFVHNSAEAEGGGVGMWRCSVSFEGNNHFVHNSAEEWGGGIITWISTVSFDGCNSFEHNSADFGGGVDMVESTVSFDGNNSFVHNSAEFCGGGVCMLESTVSFVGNNTFAHNSAIFIGGGLAAFFASNIELSGSSIFTHNPAKYGGGVYVWSSTVSSTDNSSFTHNSAASGGGIQAQNSTINIAGTCSFMYNTAQDKGGGIYVVNISTLTIDGESYFSGNTASYFGGGVATLHSMVDITGRSHFTNNSGKYGGGIYADESEICWSGIANFLANSVIHDGYSDGDGGAIHALSSTLIFGGNMEFNNNSAGYGGAITLRGPDQSKMYLLSNTTIIFKGNLALHRGGAIHVEDNPFTYCIFDYSVQSRLREACFFQLLEYQLVCDSYSYQISSLRDDYDIQLLFQDNRAIEAGSVLYGGSLDTCAVCIFSLGFYIAGTVALDRFSSEVISTSDISDISSDPYRVCVCEDNHPNCSETVITREVYPGEIIHITGVAVGQTNGTSPAVIHADWEGLEIGNLQNTQTTNKTCSHLQYTVLATEPENDNTVLATNEEKDDRSIMLYADEPCSRSGYPLKIKVKFRSCPDGFSLSTQGRCTCEERLQRYTTECDINDQSIQRRGEFWVGFDNQSRGLILHPHCPFDYCKSGTINITLNNSDVQCDHNRSGILCGACQRHLSLALGSSRCLPCSNTFISLVFPFAIAGFALVTFLFICKLTVAAGTISGLIFYANIIAVNKTLFFPSGETNIMTVFIAWLNLDLGIETCFFDGMDAYSMTWLQFVFPLYIWLLVGLITVICNVSTTAARILGSTNPIAVLATLFLLSYTKLLRTIIAAFSFTTLEYPDDEIKVVWLYDGSIGYLDKNDGRHIALFLASLLVFLFLFLPYTLFLLFGQCIVPRLDPNKLRCLSWANYLRMKSFLDAYHAPYKDRHRYWIGLLLLVRFILFLVSATVDIESPHDPRVNLLVIIICTSMLGMWVWNASGGVYKKWYLNALEPSFILYLNILAGTTLYFKLAGGNQAAVFYTSVSITFVTFIGIITYHVCQRVMDTRVWRNTVHKIHNRKQPCEIPMEEVPPAPRPPPTVSVVDMAVLREPLLST